MAFHQDRHSTAVPASLKAQEFHWENGDGAQHFSANPITADNGDITLVTMQQLETGQPERHMLHHGWDRQKEQI